MKKSITSMMNSKQLKQITIGALFFVIGVMSASLYKERDYIANNPNKITHDSTSYKFTSPILDCQATDQGDESVIPYKSVSNLVDELKEKYNVGFISIYFRDLNDGPWVGINESELFAPASLLKVPFLIGFLKYAEDYPSILDKKIRVTEVEQTSALVQDFKPSVHLELGKEYNLEEVAEHMVEYSDNIGVKIMLKYVPIDYVSDIYSAIGVKYTENNNDFALTVKDYSAFFRVLFNASYLDRNMSEKALEILSKVEYKDGLVAGVPSDVVVSHKFGERASGNAITGNIIPDGETQLHDCGIVYYPNRPYILCIMTRGTNFDNQQSAIKDISSFFYKKIDSLHNNWPGYDIIPKSYLTQ